MEHPCYQCGRMVDDGVAFCRNCNAPQIRVAEPEITPRTIEGQFTPEASVASPTKPGHIEWARALPATAVAGVVASLFMITPLGPFGLWMVVAGILSVVFYRRRNRAAELTPGMGAKLGAVSGIIGFGLMSILMSASLLVKGAGGDLRSALLQKINEAASRSPDPQVQQMFEYFKTPAGLALIIVLGLAFTFVIFLILSAAGGALVAVLLRRKQRT